MDILKKKLTSQHLRPSTPALWAAAINDPDTLPPQKPNVPPAAPYSQISSTDISSPSPQPKSESGATTSDTASSQSQQSDYEYDQYEYDQYEYDDQPHSNEKEDWVDIEAGEPSTNSSTGGWVTTGITPWTKKKTASRGSVVAGTSSPKANQIVKICNNGSGNGGVEWGNDMEENYESYWNPTPGKVSPQPVQQMGRSSNTKTSVGSDQWGQANKFVSWKDTEPYVGDVLESQHKTTYWSQQDGEWKALQGGDQQSNGNNSPSNGRADVGTERRSTPSRFSTSVTTKRPSTRPAPNDQVDHSTFLLRNSFSSSNLNDNGAKSYSLSSDDSDVDWDDDDGITIKINGNATAQQQNRNASSTRHLGKSSWKERKDWGMPATGDTRLTQGSPMATHGPGLATNNIAEGIKRKGGIDSK